MKHGIVHKLVMSGGWEVWQGLGALDGVSFLSIFDDANQSFHHNDKKKRGDGISLENASRGGKGGGRSTIDQNGVVWRFDQS